MEDIIFELKGREKDLWSQRIKAYRNKIVKSPSQYVEEYFRVNHITLDIIKNNISNFIYEIRGECWEGYLLDEVKFHRAVILSLFKEGELPRNIFNNLIDKKIQKDDALFIEENFVDNIASIFGDFTGRIMPFIYYLSLSTTNSRRSRAGKTFEAIIGKIMELYGYPYEDQASLGKKFYSENDLGKIIDGILPGKQYYLRNRAKCQIITMKTTLRERWQEVVEELNRTNIPQIHLLTLDTGLTTGVLDVLKQHNIVVVNYDEMVSEFSDYDNIISYNDFFNKEIPHMLHYWNLS